MIYLTQDNARQVLIPINNAVRFARVHRSSGSAYKCSRGYDKLSSFWRQISPHKTTATALLKFAAEIRSRLKFRSS